MNYKKSNNIQININLTEIQIAALLSRVNSIEKYVQKLFEEIANNIIMQDGC